MMSYEETKEFTRDLKKLKRFSSLADDLRIVKKNAIELFHLQKIDNRGILKIQGAGNTDDLQFYKIKKFACKSLPGHGVKSGIRIIYAYFPNEQRVVFLEIYFKAVQENENRKRISDFLNLTKKYST